jgi:hypothetical protein
MEGGAILGEGLLPMSQRPESMGDVRIEQQ